MEPNVSVADSYDLIAQSHTGDMASRTTPFRHFNNYVKSRLISSALDYVWKSKASTQGTSSQLAVLDLASGRGGDIGKWLLSKRTAVTHYHCFDISSESILEAQRRYDNLDRKPVEATFEVADCFSDEFLSVTLPALPFYGQYSVISIQFAFHYACASEEKMRQVINAIATALRPGGVFIATTINEEALAAFVRTEQTEGNHMFSVQLIEPVNWVTSFQTKKTLLAIGSQYHFQLKGFVDSPEYVVPMNMVKKLASIAGLTENREVSKPFEDYLEPYHLSRNSHELPEEEQALVKLYCTMMFVKGNAKGNHANHNQRRQPTVAYGSSRGGRGGGQKKEPISFSRDAFGTHK